MVPSLSEVREPLYRATYRFTVEYLRDERGVHNLLYAYSPDTRGIPLGRTVMVFPEDHDAFRRTYFYGYPGDGYVDVFGMDNYADVELRRRVSFEHMLEPLTAAAHSRSDMNGADRIRPHSPSIRRFLDELPRALAAQRLHSRPGPGGLRAVLAQLGPRSL